MRAGDFFGEIGILNLDGLNKRTADVRSVGYSELFSLSREDVLTAMKDYPEAQEILQSLGRKRLMEAKLAAAGLKKDTDGDSVKESGGGGDPLAAEERADGESEGLRRNRALQVMRRIKKDARELRNYIRRGMSREPLPREETRRAEGVRIEMEPLSPGSADPSDPGPAAASTLSVLEKDSSLRKLLWGKNKDTGAASAREVQPSKTGSRTKGILMRMQKITSQPEPPASDSASVRTPSPPATSVDGAGEEDGPSEQLLGAGLPLFQRLRMLKEREEKAARARGGDPATIATTSAAPAPTTAVVEEQPPPPPPQQQQQQQLQQLPPPDEPIGAGLPLFQRLRMLKEREEKERAEAERQQQQQQPPAGIQGGAGKLSLAKAVLLKKLETLREEEKGDGGGGTVEGAHVSPQVQPSIPQPPPRTPPMIHKEEDVRSPVKCSSPTKMAGGILFSPPPSLKATEFKPEEYLADLLLGVKQVLQTRLEEIQGQFKSRLISLEEEVKRKNLIIQRLEETLQRCEVYNESHGLGHPPPPKADATAMDSPHNPPQHKEDAHVPVSSPGEASFDEDDDYFDDEFEQASDVTHPGYVSHPRRSWPLLPPWSERHRVGVPQRAWESQAALVLDPEHLWRAEFPLEPRVPPLPPAWAAESTSALNGSSLDEDDDDDQSSRDAFDDGSGGEASSEDDDQDESPAQPRGNQWEIQMLAEQLLNKRPQHHVTDADPTDTDSTGGGGGRVPLEGEADEGDEGPRRRSRRKVVRKSRSRVEDRSRRLDEGQEEEVDEADTVGDKEEDVEDDGGSGGGLLGVLQQLSPTEQRELERLLAVATRKHLTRQLSLRSSEATLQVPVRRRSVASLGGPPSAGPSLLPARRRPPAPLPPPPPPPSVPSSAYLHVTAAAPPTSTGHNLLSPPTDDDSVSICIPEYEPLLGPKQ